MRSGRTIPAAFVPFSRSPPGPSPFGEREPPLPCEEKARVRANLKPEALEFGQLASFNRLHEHVPLGRGQLHEVPCLTDAHLLVIKLNHRAGITSRTERDSLCHSFSPPFSGVLRFFGGVPYASIRGQMTPGVALVSRWGTGRQPSSSAVRSALSARSWAIWRSIRSTCSRSSCCTAAQGGSPLSRVARICSISLRVSPRLLALVTKARRWTVSSPYTRYPLSVRAAGGSTPRAS